MVDKKFNSIVELLTTFPTEQSCIDHLEKIRWEGSIISPFDSSSKVYRCGNNRYKCKNTGKYFNVKTNTIFENTKVPLVKWFIASYLDTAHKKGISSLQLSRDIGVTQKTAWFMLQRIRKCFEDNKDEKLDGVVEIDETFVGGKNKNRHWDKKVPKCQGRSYKDKTPVFGILQRNGKVIAKVVPNTQVKTLRPLIKKYIEKGSVINTDDWYYGNLHEEYIHRQVNHKAKVYAVGYVYTNTLEGFWSIFKRGMTGIYNHVSRKHMQLYVDEFAFRYNTRKCSQSERFNLLLQNTNNRRLRYKDLIYG